MDNNFQLRGTFVAATMSGFVSQPWVNNPEKFNHRIILANPYVDNNGFNQTEVITIDVSHDDIQRVQQLCTQLRDKQVIVFCSFQARQGGKSGAWLSRFMPRGSEILLTSDLLKKVA